MVPLLHKAVGVRHLRMVGSIQPPKSAFAGFRFPPEVILIAVRWYLRYGLSFVIEGHAFFQNLRRGHYELGIDARPGLTLAAAFDELALVM